MTRTTFSEVEIAYLASQRLGRIATVDRHGAPRVAPIGFRYNPETGTIDCGGHNFAATYRYRDIQADPRVAITIDDLASIQPWRPRAVLVRGTAELFDAGGEGLGPGFGGAWMRITPTSIRSLGLTGEGR
jgi:pyridoxamine 5'-phosphate oxidase family protein